MDFQDTRPASLDGLQDGLDDLRVSSTVEIAALLRQLIERATPLHITCPEGASYTTLLWTQDSARRRISFSADSGAPQLQQLLDAQETTVVGYLDSIKLQFELSNLVLVQGAGSCALQADWPAELLRFQRRKSFRVRTRGAPTAHLRHPAQPERVLALRVLDVSSGGCALFLPDDVPPLPAGVQLPHVRLELDVDTRFSTTLQLQHVTALNAGSGGVRLGCQMVDTRPDAQRALQRYIDQAQRRMRLLGGLL